MTSGQHGFIHTTQGRLLTFTANETTQISMVYSVSLCPSIIRSTASFKLIRSSPGFAVLNHAFPSPFPGTSFRQMTTPHTRLSEHVIKHRQTTCAASVSTSLRNQARSTRCTLEFWLSVSSRCKSSTTHSTFRQSQSMFSTFRQSQSMFSNSRQSQSMFSTSCRFRSRRAADSSLLCDPQRQPRTSSRYAATCSLQALVHLPLGQVCVVPKSAWFSHPGTFAMVNSRRATASCTHKTWVWRCLARPTPRLEAIAFDALASTRTRGLTTFAMSAAVATPPRALEALLVNA